MEVLEILDEVLHLVWMPGGNNVRCNATSRLEGAVIGAKLCKGGHTLEVWCFKDEAQSRRYGSRKKEDRHYGFDNTRNFNDKL